MKQLIKHATLARENAYAPYSKFKVGAALEAANGQVFTGCNVENASYGLTICSERVAISKAVSEGVTKFRSIAIVSNAKQFATPCGACRQVMSEFNSKLEIILVNASGKIQRTNLSKLLPKPFKLTT